MNAATLITDPDMFARKQKEYQEFIRGNYPEIDEGMSGIVRSINLLPGVVTFSSCRGHISHPKKNKAYVQCVANATGVNHLFQLFALIQDCLQNYIPKDRTLHFEDLELPYPNMVKLDVSAHWDIPTKRHFRSITFKTTVVRPSQQEGWLRLFRTTLELYHRDLMRQENERLIKLANEKQTRM